MADFPITAVEFASQKKRDLDPSLAPDLPDLSGLSLSELEILSRFNLAITEASMNMANQPRCTGRVEQIMDEIETRAWHFVNAIAEEAASRQPANNREQLIRAQIMLGTVFETEDMEGAILRLADEIRAKSA